MSSLLAALGRSALRLCAGIGGTVAFCGGALVAMRSTTAWHAAAAQALTLTLRCSIPAVLVVGPIGAMLSMQALTLMRQFGVEAQLAPLAAAVIVRELSPGFAAVVVAMQGGAGIAAELGAMRVSEEIDAIDVMGLDARGMLAGPRIVGAAIAAPLVNALAVAAGIAGAYLMAVPVLGVPRTLFLDHVLDGFGAFDIWVSEGKTVLFGLGLGAICAAAGYRADKSAAGVGIAANRAVVASVVFILLFNYILNTALFGLRAGGLAS